MSASRSSAATDAGIPATPSYSNAAFGRLQVFHPISLLVLVASFAITSLVIDPKLGTVAKRHPTYFNPNETWLMGYWAVLFILQVGTALSIALAATDHTKALLANGISMSLPIANLMLAIWAPLFIADKIPTFIAGEVALGIATLLLGLSVFVTGLKQVYSPTWRRPVEWLIIHLPARMFFAVLLHADIWQQGFIAFGLAPTGPISSKTIWPSFIIIVSVGLCTALWTFATTDLAFGAAGIYLQLAILFVRKPPIDERPAEVIAAHILAIVLLTVAIVASLAWTRVTSRTEGRIALPVSPHEEAALAQAELEAQAAERRAKSRREDAQRLRDESGSGTTPSQLERGEGPAAADETGSHGVTRKLGSAH